MNRRVSAVEQSAFAGRGRADRRAALSQLGATGDAGGRAEAASALARAYLYSELGAELRREVAIALPCCLTTNPRLCGAPWRRPWPAPMTRPIISFWRLPATSPKFRRSCWRARPF